MNEAILKQLELLQLQLQAAQAQVHALARTVRARWPATEVTLHFHNTRGMGLANVLAGIDAGADRFGTGSASVLRPMPSAFGRHASHTSAKAPTFMKA